MEAINTPTYVRLCAQIRSDIVSGLWPLGSHVTLAELSTHYKVSASPVREALLQLQGEGIVDMRMHRGAVVPAVDRRYIDDIYRLRGAIQAMLARDAAARATDDDIRRLRSLAEAHESAAADGDAGECVAANREFHRFMDALGGNEIALEVLASRSALVDAFRRSRGYGAGRLDSVIAQHRKLVRAIAKRDADKAAAAAIEHAESSRADLLRLLQPAS